MKFWIVTPSYNQLEWLKLCIASVRDQVSDGVKSYDLSIKSDAGIKPKTVNLQHRFDEPIYVHHHIQDGGSTDGTVEFLKKFQFEVDSSKFEVQSDGEKNPQSTNHQLQTPMSGYTFSYESVKDNGMYDAINRGWKRAPDDVDVIAHLNCDEQYLPKALKTIAAFVADHPRVDVVLADMIVVDRAGEYICHRRSVTPTALLSRYCCAAFTATTFHRISVTKDKNVFFDTSWRNFGDKVWYNALHRAGCRFAVCHQIVALFTDTGENLNWTEEGLREKHRYEIEFLRGRVFGTRVVSRINGLRRFMRDLLLSSPSEYSIFRGSETKRKVFQVEHPTGIWRKKWIS